MASKVVLFGLLSILAFSAAQRITTIQLDGVQYFISRMNPYSPELNYFLAYQYCRSLGLQLASFETQEKVESMTQYLKNAGFGKYDFWTSGNRLGTGMFLWMSTGLPFNATFDYFENSAGIPNGLDPVDHNSNTSPQRTARDSSSGIDKGCVLLKGPSLKWQPQDCSAVKDFICEQTRCYYYNYGSIPVSSAQGIRNSRPIISTTTPRASTYLSTTPYPHLISTYASIAKQQQKLGETNDLSEEPTLESLKLDHEQRLSEEENENEEEEEENARSLNSEPADPEPSASNEHPFDRVEDETVEEEEHSSAEVENSTSEIPSVERLKQISQEFEKSSENISKNTGENDLGRQSFLSLSDLIRNFHPNDKQIVPQIDSDYSNAKKASLVSGGGSSDSTH